MITLTLIPNPEAQSPESYSLNRKPQTLNPEPSLPPTDTRVRRCRRERGAANTHTHTPSYTDTHTLRCSCVYACTRVRVSAKCFLRVSVPATHISKRQVEMERWLQTHETSPLTNEKLPHKKLVPNHNLRNQIAAFNASGAFS